MRAVALKRSSRLNVVEPALSERISSSSENAAFRGYESSLLVHRYENRLGQQGPPGLYRTQLFGRGPQPLCLHVRTKEIVEGLQID